VRRADVLAAVQAAQLRLSSMESFLDELKNDLEDIGGNLDSIEKAMDEEGDE